MLDARFSASRYARVGNFLSLSLFSLLLPACGGGEVSGPPPSSAGSIQVTAATINSDVGPAELAVSIDGTAVGSIGANATATFADISVGARSVELGSVADPCVLREGAKAVDVSAGETARVSFIVVCDAGGPVSDGFLFVRTQDGNEDIYAMNLDGTGLVNLTDHPARDADPDVSPDGNQIVFNSRGRDPNPNPWQIWIMNVDGTGLQRLSDGTQNEVNPSWSPDGAKIVFDVVGGGGVGGHRDIFVMNADGGSVENVSQIVGNDELARWSPDGGKIVFAADGDGTESNFDIHTMNADGTGRTRLTLSPQWELSADWSPDGKKIVFDSERDGNWEIYLMNADGSGQIRLTSDPRGDQAPRWSPDGTQILFQSDRSGEVAVYLMEADGTGIRRLTDGSAAGFGST